MKFKFSTRVLFLAGSLLTLSGFAEDISILRDETGVISHTRRNTETGELYDIGGVSQSAPAYDAADYDQFPPTAAGSTAPKEVAAEEPPECGW